MEHPILPPSLMKRGRMDISSSPPMQTNDDAVRLTSLLNQAVTTESRRNVLSLLFHQVGYNSETRSCRYVCFVGSLVRAGAINALCLQLGFVLNKHQSSSQELNGICRALGLLLHCSDELREASLREVGPDLVALLVKAMRHGNSLSKREVVSVWHAVASCNTGINVMIKCRGLMKSLSMVLRDAEQSNEAAVEALGLLKRLTFNAEESRLQILDQPGMLKSLAQLPFVIHHDVKGIEWLSSIFRNIAVTPSTRVVLAQNTEVLSALIRLASQGSRRATRNVLCTLDCLAMESDYCVGMVMHGDGILLNVLRRMIEEEPDDVVRRRAARALRLLARDKAIPLLINDNILMDSLASCALHDSAREVRIEAASAFTSCSSLVRAPMPQHDAVLESLTNLANEKRVLPEVVAKALKEQALHPMNRVPMANHVGLLHALAKIAMEGDGSVVAKGYATSALYDLSSEEANREKMATPQVLQALVTNATDRNDDMREARDQSIKTLLNLALVASNLKQMATHEGLLNALVQYAATATEAESKGAVKRVIMSLVPLL